MSANYTGPERRAGRRERRTTIDRRSGMDRRRGPGRRRGEVRKAAEEGEISGELLEFIMAIDEYKRINERPFPSWSEVFEIIQYLGYRKVAERAKHINTASGAEVLESPSGGEAKESSAHPTGVSNETTTGTTNAAKSVKRAEPVIQR